MTKQQREDLRNHLFYTLRMYMIEDSVYNQYDDMVLFYSYDTKQFLKRSERNKKQYWNWIIIPHDKYEFYYLKKELNIKSKEELTLHGRKLFVGFEKDDLWMQFNAHVDKTFEAFLKLYNQPNTKTKPIDGSTAKPLF